jgi:hypothetical protein
VLPVLLVTALLTGCSAAREAATPRPVAGHGPARLTPNTFPELPRAVSEDLARRGCTIPQTYLQRGPRNVISGRFRDSRQRDWAILCSRDRASTILVYWGGSTADVTRLAKSPDDEWLQDVGHGRFGFSRFIRTATADALRHKRRASGSSHPPITHDGIEQGMIEKGSSVYYWNAGRWGQLPGTD